MTRLGRTTLAALLAVWTFAHGAQAQTLTPDQMRGTAMLAIEDGNPALALQVAEALLVRDAEDVTALILKARAARDLGQFDIAQPAAARAWALSDTDATRFDSARVMAQVLASQGQRTRAQFWLRRAVQNAPDAGARRIAVQEFRYVSARNPWNTQLNFSVAPNSNINNGSVKDTTEILNFFSQDYVVANLSGAAVALSGLEISTGATLRYSLLESPAYRTDLLVQADTRRYVLSDEAERIAPTATASDFALDSLNVGIDHRWRDRTRAVEYQVGALVGATRYGGEHYSDQARLSFGVNRTIDGQTLLGAALAADVTRGPLAPHADGLRLGLNLQHRHSSGTLLAARLSLSQSRSDSENADYDDVRLDLFAEPDWSILGAEAQFGVSLRARDYDSFVFFSPDGRRDREMAVYLMLSFTEAEYYGFIPTMTLEASHTDSNIGLYDVNRVGLQLGIRSAF
ncbi:MAG: surface lipoprotein assembly modifier [Paracoccaceae bacterium]